MTNQQQGAVERTLKHQRRIDSKGYLRSDGLWDIEATLLDVKTYDVLRDFDGVLVPTGAPFHDFTFRITVDDTFLIRDVSVEMDRFPFPNCSGAAVSFQKLVGSRIGSGWNAWVRKEFKGVAGCTHLLELLPVLATTAFQTMWQPLSEKYPKHVKGALKGLINSCHGWSEDGPVAQKLKKEGL